MEQSHNNKIENMNSQLKDDNNKIENMHTPLKDVEKPYEISKKSLYIE